MRIFTITCHDVYNTGASLQAYALMRYLEYQGHEVTIINYKPDYLCHHYRFLDVANKKYEVVPLRYIYLILKFPERLISYITGRKQNFDKFTKNKLRITDRVYKSNEQLKVECPEGDIFIAGSDQIWNPLFPNGKDRAFYLDFVPENSKKVSYAASMVVKNLSQEQKGFVNDLLKNFDAISVREKSAEKIIHSMGLKAETVLDPVFLLEKSEWENMIVSERKLDLVCKKPYLFVYDFEQNEWISEYAKKLSDKYGLEIISFFNSNSRGVKASGPIEFLKIIKDARCILSNSFHATAFSIIFEKDFYVFNRKEDLNSRMEELLKKFNLLDRIMAPQNVDMKIKSIDYRRINTIVGNEIAESKRFLQKALL